MSHCPNCRQQDGPCTIKNPCCDCVVKAIRATEQDKENAMKNHALCLICGQAVTIEPTGYLSFHENGTIKSCPGAARMVTSDRTRA